MKSSPAPTSSWICRSRRGERGSAARSQERSSGRARLVASPRSTPSQTITRIAAQAIVNTYLRWAPERQDSSLNVVEVLHERWHVQSQHHELHVILSLWV